MSLLAAEGRDASIFASHQGSYVWNRTEPRALPAFIPLLSLGVPRLHERHMSGLTEEAIRTRAYQLWKAAGEPHGNMDSFWYQAEKELLNQRSSRSEPCEESWRRTPLGRNSKH